MFFRVEQDQNELDILLTACKEVDFDMGKVVITLAAAEKERHTQ